MVSLQCDSLGTLKLTAELGRGGMASVWHATDSRGDAFAVKMLAPYFSDVEEVIQRFDREADILGRVHDDSIVKMRARGTTAAGIPFVVMDALGGESLDKLLRREGQLSFRDTVSVIRQLLHALDTVHQAGVAHRDVKPGNIMVERTEAGMHLTLIDFGVAYAAWDASVTDADKTVGTAHYMSPEQAFEPERAGIHADLWAAAVVAYECLTGTLPFDGATFASVCVALHAGTFVKASEQLPTLSAGVDAFFARAFARNLADRFVDADEMRDATPSLVAESGTFLIGNVGRVRSFAAGMATTEALDSPSRAPVSLTPAWVALTRVLAHLVAVLTFFVSRARHLTPKRAELLREGATP